MIYTLVSNSIRLYNIESLSIYFAQLTNLTQILKQSLIHLCQMSVNLRPTAIATTTALSVMLLLIII